jgi:hypothetical protein
LFFLAYFSSIKCPFAAARYYENQSNQPMEIPKLITIVAEPRFVNCLGCTSFKAIQIIIVINKLGDFLPVKTHFQEIKYN